MRHWPRGRPWPLLLLLLLLLQVLVTALAALPASLTCLDLSDNGLGEQARTIDPTKLTI